MGLSMSNNETEFRYLIKNRYLSAVKEIPITKEDYELFKRSRRVLSAALAIEELFDILFENYREAERTFRSCSELYIGFEDFTYYSCYEIMRAANVKFINFIAAARFYVDNLKANFNELDEVVYGRVKKKASELYDGSIEYRIIDQLRNYALHAGAVVHGITGSFVAPKHKDTELATFYASKAIILERSNRIKSAVLAELPERIDLAESMHVSMSKYKELHACVREEIASVVDTARKHFEDTIRYAESELGEKTGLAACVYSNCEELEFTQIFLEWDDVRVRMAEGNKVCV